MTDRPLRPLRSAVVLLVVALCVTGPILALASVPAAAQQDTDGSSGGQEIVVQQGERCYPLAAFGNGSRSVEAFYDYRSPETDPPGWYFSYGNRTGELMATNTSQVFLYNGSDGLSLVFLHDGVARANTTGSGGTVTMDISGLPADGNWSVQDDDYRDQDDVFDLGGSSAHIEWVWNEGNRSDGAAYTGLDSREWEEITIRPRFNEASPQYPFEKWDDPPDSNRIDTWVARSATASAGATRGNGSTSTSTNGTAGANATGTNGTTYPLDMSEPITIARGPCDAQPPTAALSANRTDPTPGERVTFDAGGSADNDAIAEYRWDTDGDGTVDTTTNGSTLTTTYNRTGEYGVRVTVVDRANNTANATVALQVEEETTTASTAGTDGGSDDGDATTTGSETGTESASPGATDDGGSGDGNGVLGTLQSDVPGIDGPSLFGLVVLTLALCVLAVVVLRR